MAAVTVAVLLCCVLASTLAQDLDAIFNEPLSIAETLVQPSELLQIRVNAWMPVALQLHDASNPSQLTGITEQLATIKTNIKNHQGGTSQERIQAASQVQSLINLVNDMAQYMDRIYRRTQPSVTDKVQESIDIIDTHMDIIRRGDELRGTTPTDPNSFDCSGEYTEKVYYPGQANEETQCYYFSTEEATFDDARQACLDRGMDLANIMFDEENVFVGNQLDGIPPTTTYRWLGGKRHEQVHNSLYWLETGNIAFHPYNNNWAPGFPTSTTEITCVKLELSHLQWEDGSCDDAYPYVCKWFPPPADGR